MKNILIFLSFVIIPAYSIYQQEQLDDKPVVKTEYGYVRGYEKLSRSGRKYYAFTKIPYAKPPLGKLRFKNALPPEPWDGVLDADKNLPECWQIPIYDPLRRHLTYGTEDCLYLSIFTPKVSNEAKLPVMIFIHGGGWRSELPHNGPAGRADYLMDQDVILIFFHYRLGPIGFMSTEDDVLPGNLGLKDQAELIRWTVGNIERFGGDSKKITVFGNSAGGASVHYHLVSPVTKDLIQGGISQSGVATCLWSLNAPGVTANRTKKLAEHLGCSVESSQHIVNCLETKTAEEITNSERLFVSGDYLPTIAFPPVIEHGENSFVSGSPYVLHVEKPWIVGMTAEDGAFKLAGQRTMPDIMESILNKGYEKLPEIVMYTNTSSHVDEISQKIYNRYIKQDEFQKNLQQLWTDSLFTYCSMEALNMAKNNVYFYVYSHRSKTTWLDLQAKTKGIDNSDLGASHTDELFSLFNYDDALTEPDMKSQADDDVSKQVIKLWTDFAKYGYPKSNENWKPYDKKNGNYLNISEHSSVDSHLWPDRVKFWKSLPLRDKMMDNNL